MPLDRRTLRRPLSTPALLTAAGLVLGSLGASPLAAQPPQPAGENTETTADPGADARAFDDPFDAYEAEAWEKALEGFLDRRAQRPDDPAELLNVGSTHYQMGEYEEAVRAFRTAAVPSPDSPTTVREKAFYNLGNTAYRQGRLEEAVEHYRKALELDPEDQDAKLNLEFVQRELQRRQQQSQQQPQPGQNGEQGENQDTENPNQENQSPQNQGSQGQDPQSQEQPSEEPSQDQPPESSDDEASSPQPRPAPEGPDQDGDGLPDQLEREAENPTDPANPDTDGDGLPDGAEDLDADGQVDPQETDPNRRDTDGDGIPDGEEAQGRPPGEAQGAPAEPVEGLTEAEALRYLMALEESPPPHKTEDARAARAGRPAKDW